MYLKCITKNNITRLYFYESYYKDQKTRQRMVKGLGRLDELEKLYPNPVSHFTELAKNETIKQKTDKNMMFGSSLLFFLISILLFNNQVSSFFLVSNF